MQYTPQDLKQVMSSGLLSFPVTDFDAQGDFIEAADPRLGIFKKAKQEKPSAVGAQAVTFSSIGS